MTMVVEISNAKFFQQPLNRVFAAVNGKNAPIQQNILLRASAEDGLTMTGLDTRTHQLTLRVPDAQVFEEGMALVSASILKDLAGSLPEAPMSLSVDEQDSKLMLAAGTANRDIELFGEPPEKFLELVEELPPVVARLDAEDFCEAVKRSMKLTEKDTFVTIAGKGTDVLVYSMIRSKVFNLARLENRDDSDNWAIAVMMNHLAKMPTFVGEAEIGLDLANGLFSVSCGAEHLFIRQTTRDHIMNDVDVLMDCPADGYWVVKQDGLLSDLKAATAIKDRRGLALEVRGNGLFASCSRQGCGAVRTLHPLVDAEGGEGIKMHFAPDTLQKTCEALGGVDLLAEVVEQSSKWDDDDPDEIPMVFHVLRLMDKDKPEARKVVVLTLDVNEE